MSNADAVSDSGPVLSKWQILALLGLGVSVTAVSVGAVWYLRRERTPSTQTPPDPEPSSNNNAVPNNEEVAIPEIKEADPAAKMPLTPSEQAIQLKTRGNELFKQKNFDEAIKLYEEALTVCPSSRQDDLAAFHHNIAACLEHKVASAESEEEKTDLWKEIASRCSTAIGLKPKYIKAISKRFRAYDFLQRKRDALLDAVRVALLDERQGQQQFSAIMPRLLKEIGQKHAEANYKKLKPLEPPTQLIKAYFSTYNWKDDISRQRLVTLWDSRKSSSPSDNDPDIVTEKEGEKDEGFDTQPFVKAATLFRNNTFSEILQVLTEAVQTGHDVFKPHAYLLRGALYCLWRRDQEALGDLQRVTECKGLSAELYADAHIKRAAIFAGLCDLTACHEEFTEASSAKPDHPDIYIQRARVLLESEDVNTILKAMDDLEVAYKLAPSAPHTLYCMGAVYHRGGLLSGSVHLLEGARRKFEDAYSNFPTCVEGLILYSLYLQDAQEGTRCEELLQEAIKLEPDNSSAHFSLSLMYLLAHQDIDRAVKSLEAAIAMDSSCIQAYETLASLEMQRGNNDKATHLYQQAIDNSRSVMELQQAYIAYEVFTTQNEVCEEYNINPLDLMSSRIAAANKGLQQNY